MRILSRGASLLVLLLLVANCSGLLKKKGDDADTSDATTVEAAEAGPAPTPAPAALASNEGDIARFPDETKIADETATLQRTYNVREAPPNGELIVTLGKGASVTKIASRDKYFLILFNDPKGSGSKVMGWVHRDAFSAVIQDAGPLSCPSGEVALFGDTPFCGKLCSADTDCPTGQACKGSAAKLKADGKPGDSVTLCILYHHHDAGAPTPSPATRDAGPAPKADAAAPPAPAADAGPAPAADVVPAQGGKCPGNFVLVTKTGKCHRPCPGGPTGGECKNRPFNCIKCDRDEKKVCAESQIQCR